MNNEDKLFREIAEVYLYNELDNWEWTYKELVDMMVGEFDTDGIEHLVGSIPINKQFDLFEKYLVQTIEDFVPLETIATDEMNDYMLDELEGSVRNTTFL